MSSILITGGAGFIGSHFVRFWLDTYAHRVVNLDKLTCTWKIIAEPSRRY